MRSDNPKRVVFAAVSVLVLVAGIFFALKTLFDLKGLADFTMLYTGRNVFAQPRTGIERLPPAKGLKFLAHEGGAVKSMAMAGKHLLLACGSELRSFSVNDQGALLPGSSITLLGKIYELRVANGKAYVANGRGGLRIIAVEDPAKLSELGSYGHQSAVESLAVCGQRVFLSADDNVEIVDTTNPSNACRVGDLGRFLPCGFEAKRLLASTERLCVIDHSRGILVFDPAKLDDGPLYEIKEPLGRGAVCSIEDKTLVCYTDSEKAELCVFSLPAKGNSPQRTTLALNGWDVNSLDLSSGKLTVGCRQGLLVYDLKAIFLSNQNSNQMSNQIYKPYLTWTELQDVDFTSCAPPNVFVIGRIGADPVSATAALPNLTTKCKPQLLASLILSAKAASNGKNSVTEKNSVSEKISVSEAQVFPGAVEGTMHWSDRKLVLGSDDCQYLCTTNAPSKWIDCSSLQELDLSWLRKTIDKTATAPDMVAISRSFAKDGSVKHHIVGLNQAGSSRLKLCWQIPIRKHQKAPICIKDRVYLALENGYISAELTGAEVPRWDFHPLSGQVGGIFARDEFLFVATSENGLSRVVKYNMKNRLKPRYVAEFSVEAKRTTALAGNKNFLFLAAGNNWTNNQLFVLEAGQRGLSRIATFKDVSAENLVCNEEFLVAAEPFCLRKYTLSSPNKVAQSGLLDTSAVPLSIVDMEIVNNRLFLSCADDGVYVYELSTM